MKENSGENPTRLENRYRTTVFVILAQVFAVFVLTAAALVLRPRFSADLKEQDFTTLWIGLLFLAVGSFIMRRLMFGWERLRNVALLKGLDGLLAALQRKSLLLAALGLLIGIYGFVIAGLSGNPFDMVRAALVSTVVFFVNFPRRNVWRTIVTTLEKI